MLRASIGRRGTARVALALASLVAWAALTLTTIALSLPPITTLAPLVVLAAGFESVFALHVGVERIGRYLQVYYETGPSEPPAWEHVAMAPKMATTPRVATDPLFGVLFLLAVAVNFLPVLLVGARVELLVVGIAHLALVTRIVMAHRFAATQRRADLAHISSIRGGTFPTPEL